MSQQPPGDTAGTVLILQFSERVPPGHLRSFLDRHRVLYHILRVDLPFELSQYIDCHWRAIVVLGGPQGAYEEAEYPYLRQVKQLLSRQLQRESPSPILGICLGCQILADVIGGSAYRSKQPEVGFVPMTASAVGAADPLVSRLLPFASQSLFLNHHGDTFALPDGVPVLLSSACHPQAFRYRSAFAVQFHPETGPAEFSQWLAADSDERMRQVGRSKDEISEELKQRADAAHVASAEFMRLWWQEVEDGESLAATAGRQTALQV